MWKINLINGKYPFITRIIWRMKRKEFPSDRKQNEKVHPFQEETKVFKKEIKRMLSRWLFLIYLFITFKALFHSFSMAAKQHNILSSIPFILLFTLLYIYLYLSSIFISFQSQESSCDKQDAASWRNWRETENFSK